jgi:hypothetical protein
MNILFMTPINNWQDNIESLNELKVWRFVLFEPVEVLHVIPIVLSFRLSIGQPNTSTFFRAPKLSWDDRSMIGLDVT